MVSRAPCYGFVSASCSRCRKPSHAAHSCMLASSRLRRPQFQRHLVSCNVRSGDRLESSGGEKVLFFGKSLFGECNDDQPGDC